jgi:hypothetical protein
MTNHYYKYISQIALGIGIATTATVCFSRNLPHADLVAKYLLDEQYKQVLTGCKTRTMIAPAAATGSALACWAAAAASDLQNESQAVQVLVLKDGALDTAFLHCKALSTEQRFKSPECAALGRADTFVALRLPRTVDTLKPVTFK